jgi:hypothetical protein
VAKSRGCVEIQLFGQEIRDLLENHRFFLKVIADQPHP